MSPRFERLAADWKTWVGVIGGISALLAALTEVLDKLAGFLGVEEVPVQWRWLAVAVLGIPALGALVAAWRRKSFLLRKTRFILSPDNPNHLVGREVEVRALAEECIRHPLIFLQGDSGVGKSALIKAGLIPYCNGRADTSAEARQLIPVLVDTSPLTWDGGLSTAIARPLKGLTEEQCTVLGASPLGDQPVWEWLKRLTQVGQRQLLVIFDQIDDYAVAHRERLMDGHLVKSAQQLEASNPEWAQLSKLVRTGAVHLLFICRSDAASVLEAFRFTRVRVFPLPRIDREVLSPILDRITADDGGGEVVAYPEFGWRQLKRALMRDAAADGNVVLPVQLAIAVQSLRQFTYLSPREYFRRGGLVGLERLNIERHLRDAAVVSEISQDALLQGALLLVSPDGQKTQRASREAISEAIGEGASEGLDRAIEHLERNRILRRQSGQDSEYLLLYHDYLARGVRETHRQKNYLVELIRERQEALDAASDLWQRWRALLPIRLQGWLLWERLRGRLSLRQHRRFVLLSALRLVPLVLLVVALSAGGWWIDRKSQERAAETLLGGLTTEVFSTPDEAKELVALASLSDHGRLHAIRFALSREAMIPKLKARLEETVHAVLGLDPKGALSHRLVNDILIPALKRDPKPTVTEVIGRAITLARISQENRPLLVAALVERMKQEKDNSALVVLETALGRVGSGTSTKQVQEGAQILIATMKSEKDSAALADLGLSLGSFRDLPVDQVRPGVALLLERMKHEQEGFALAKLGRALEKLVAQLSAAEVQPMAAELLLRMESESDSTTLAGVGFALGKLGARLPGKQAQTAATMLVERMEIESDGSTLANLGFVFSSLAAHLSTDQVRRGAEVLVKRMETEQDSPVVLGELGGALGELQDQLPVGQAERGVTALVKRMLTEEHTFVLHRLIGVGLAKLSAKLSPELAQPLAAALVKRMTLEENEQALASFSRALQVLSTQLTAAQAQPLAEALSERLKSERDGMAAAWLARALGHLGALLTADQARPLAEAVVERLKSERDNTAVAYLAFALGDLKTPISVRAAPRLTEALFVRIRSDVEGSRLVPLAGAWHRLESISNQDVANAERLQDYVELLNLPLAVGTTRRVLLAGVQEITGGEFDGDLWKFVEWATESEEGKKLNLDLEGRPWQPPQTPGR